MVTNVLKVVTVATWYSSSIIRGCDVANSISSQDISVSQSLASSRYGRFSGRLFEGHLHQNSVPIPWLPSLHPRPWASWPSTNGWQNVRNIVFHRHIACEELVIGSVTTVVHQLYVIVYFRICFGRLWPSSSKIFTLTLNFPVIKKQQYSITPSTTIKTLTF
jgi:hypothetical protein